MLSYPYLGRHSIKDITGTWKLSLSLGQAKNMMGPAAISFILQVFPVPQTQFAFEDGKAES